jgi:hypothetical protein
MQHRYKLEQTPGLAIRFCWFMLLSPGGVASVALFLRAFAGTP